MKLMRTILYLLTLRLNFFASPKLKITICSGILSRDCRKIVNNSLNIYFSFYHIYLYYCVHNLLFVHLRNNKSLINFIALWAKCGWKQLRTGIKCNATCSELGHFFTSNNKDCSFSFF